jgi:uncharacterized membrane protein
MWVTHRRGDVRAIASTTRNVVLADWLFITTSGVIQPATGIALAHMAGIPLTTPWLVATYALYLLAGICWIVVVRLQLRLARISAFAAREGKPLSAEYHRIMRLWFWLGWPAFIALIVVFALMVMKPELW